MQQRQEDRQSISPKVRIWVGHHRRRTIIGKLFTTKPEGFFPDPYYIVGEGEPISQWDIEYQKNRADLSGFLLVYLFYGNDGKVTWSEHRQMKRFIKNEGVHLSESMRTTLIGFLKHALDEERLLEIFHQKEYTTSLFDDSVKAIKPYFGQEGKYYLMIDRLKRQLKP